MSIIYTTDDSSFEPRRSYPWDSLREVLRRELGQEFEFLLAEPVARTGEGRTDWYTEHPGTPLLVSSLPPERQLHVRSVLDHQVRQVLALADRLVAPDQRNPDRGLAAELRQVMSVPDESLHLWCVDDQPVLVAWGQTKFGQPESHAPLILEGRVRGEGNDLGSSFDSAVLKKQYQDPAPTSKSVSTLGETATSNATRRPRKVNFTPLLWLCFVCLMGAVYFMLLRACGVIVAPEDSWLRSFLPTSCHASRASTLSMDIAQRNEELERMIKAAELKVAQIEGDCQTPLIVQRPVDRCTNAELQNRLRREGAASGSMEISLKWEGLEDLDLHVTCPSGASINFRNKRACGGRLDVDMNATRSSSSQRPIEHVVWREHPAAGVYRISVDLYDRQNQPPRGVPYELYIKRDGKVEGPIRGIANFDSKQRIVRTVEVPANPPENSSTEECVP